MKTFFLLLLAAIAISLAISEVVYSEAELAEWESYKQTHGKSYDASENTRRLKIYQDTKTKIAAHNARFAAGEVSYQLGINQFADRLPEEVPRGLLRS